MTTDFRDTLKTIVNEAVETRFNTEKKQLDAKIDTLDKKFEEQKKESADVKTLLMEMHGSIKNMANQKSEQKRPEPQQEVSSPESDHRIQARQVFQKG